MTPRDNVTIRDIYENERDWALYLLSDVHCPDVLDHSVYDMFRDTYGMHVYDLVSMTATADAESWYCDLEDMPVTTILPYVQY